MKLGWEATGSGVMCEGSPYRESSEIRMRLLERYSILYTSLNVRVSRIGAKLVCLSITSKQAKVALEGCHGI